jgi:hypothetical protein
MESVCAMNNVFAPLDTPNLKMLGLPCSIKSVNVDTDKEADLL